MSGLNMRRHLRLVSPLRIPCQDGGKLPTHEEAHALRMSLAAPQPTRISAARMTQLYLFP